MQVDSLEEADRKIDGLAGSGQLNPALLLTMAKAYSAAKDTNITKEEVKEIMGHLYFKVISASTTWPQRLACIARGSVCMHAADCRDPAAVLTCWSGVGCMSVLLRITLETPLIGSALRYIYRYIYIYKDIAWR